MLDLDTQKQKLQQKKARLVMEEINFKIKERKLRTKRLIELGGLVTKALLDHLPTNTLYGALLSLKEELDKHPNIQHKWTKDGKEVFDKEEKSRSAIILKFEAKPDESIRSLLRRNGLKFNYLRQEWYGYCSDIDKLKTDLKDVVYNLEIVNTSHNI